MKKAGVPVLESVAAILAPTLPLFPTPVTMTLPVQWKISYGVKFFARFFYFPFVVENGRECWKYMWRGIKEGIKGIKK